MKLARLKMLPKNYFLQVLEKRGRTNKWPLQMDVQELADQPEHIDISSVWTQDIVWKTCRERLMIGTGGERESQENSC